MLRPWWVAEERRAAAWLTKPELSTAAEGEGEGAAAGAARQREARDVQDSTSADTPARPPPSERGHQVDDTSRGGSRRT